MASEILRRSCHFPISEAVYYGSADGQLAPRLRGSLLIGARFAAAEKKKKMDLDPFEQLPRVGATFQESCRSRQQRARHVARVCAASGDSALAWCLRQESLPPQQRRTAAGIDAAISVGASNSGYCSVSDIIVLMSR